MGKEWEGREDHDNKYTKKFSLPPQKISVSQFQCSFHREFQSAQMLIRLIQWTCRHVG